MCRLPEKVLNEFCQSFTELWPSVNLGSLNLSARYLEQDLSKGVETWLAGSR